MLEVVGSRNGISEVLPGTGFGVCGGVPPGTIPSVITLPGHQCLQGGFRRTRTVQQTLVWLVAKHAPVRASLICCCLT